MDSGGAGGPRIGRWGEKAGVVFAFLALLVLAAAAAYAMGDAILAPTPIARSPGFVETVLASRAVVASVRIAVIFAAAYVVISAVWLIATRRFLVRVGPIHVSEPVSNLDAENEWLRGMLQSAGETIEDLQGELAATNEILTMIQKEEFEEGNDAAGTSAAPHCGE